MIELLLLARSGETFLSLLNQSLAFGPRKDAGVDALTSGFSVSSSAIHGVNWVVVSWPDWVLLDVGIQSW
jgi:hypothetical protein